MITVTRAAVKLGNGEILSLPRPYRHPDILTGLYRTHADAGNIIPSLHDITLGFITSDDEFVGRTAAYYIAKEAGQLLPEDRPGHTPTPGTLYTEDLW